MMPVRVAILLLAAGKSTRMGGRDKLLEQIDGVSLLRRVAQVTCDTGCDVFTVLRPSDQARDGELAGLGLTVIRSQNAHKGMGHSIAELVSAIEGDYSGYLLCLADMPLLTSADLLRVISGFDGTTITRATSHAGKPGHPVLLPARLRPHLLRLSGDQGPRELIAKEPISLVPCAGNAAITDLDTPADWEQFRSSKRSN